MILGWMMLLIMFGGIIWWADKIRSVVRKALELRFIQKQQQSVRTVNISKLRSNRQTLSRERVADGWTSSAASMVDPFDEIEEDL